MFRSYMYTGLFILFLCTLQAQENESESISGSEFERQLNVGEFINLKVYSGIELKLIPSEENKLVISGEDRMDVVAKIKGQTLKIRHSLEHIFNPTFTYVEVYHSEELDYISLYQGAKLKADSVYKQTSISLKIQEGSEAEFKFEGEKLTSIVNTGGKLFCQEKQPLTIRLLPAGVPAKEKRLKPSKVR